MPWKIKDSLVIIAIVALVAGLSFMLGRLSAFYDGKGSLKIEYPAPAVR